jgi:hypothetical protein
VYQRRAARAVVVRQRRVLAGDDERRRRDLPAHVQPAAEALGQCRLPRAQVSGEDHQVPGPQQAREPLPERARRVGVGEFERDDVRRRSVHDHAPFPASESSSSRSAPTSSAPRYTRGTRAATRVTIS